jgi:hypothetical protein
VRPPIVWRELILRVGVLRSNPCFTAAYWYKYRFKPSRTVHHDKHACTTRDASEVHEPGTFALSRCLPRLNPKACHPCAHPWIPYTVMTGKYSNPAIFPQDVCLHIR